MAANRFTLWTLVSILLASCVSAEPKSDEVKNLEAASLCMSAIDSQLNPALQSAPKDLKIRQLVQWTYAHLPSEFKEIFLRAGSRIASGEGQFRYENLVRQPLELQKRAYFLAATELETYPHCQVGDAGMVVPDKAANLFNLDLGLAQGQIAEQFFALGLDDSYYIEQSFLMMLVLEASGKPWNEQWFRRETNSP